MAFVHCHNRDCRWSQDDFWDFHFRRDGYGYFKFTQNFGWNYNPFSYYLSLLFGQIPSCRWDGYWRPRFFYNSEGDAVALGLPRIDHSWWILIKEFYRMIKAFKNQVWWTEEEFRGLCKQSEEGYRIPPKCPKCGKDELDID